MMLRKLCYWFANLVKINQRQERRKKKKKDSLLPNSDFNCIRKGKETQARADNRARGKTYWLLQQASKSSHIFRCSY